MAGEGTEAPNDNRREALDAFSCFSTICLPRPLSRDDNKNKGRVRKGRWKRNGNHFAITPLVVCAPSTPIPPFLILLKTWLLLNPAVADVAGVFVGFWGSLLNLTLHLLSFNPFLWRAPFFSWPPLYNSNTHKDRPPPPAHQQLDFLPLFNSVASIYQFYLAPGSQPQGPGFVCLDRSLQERKRRSESKDLPCLWPRDMFADMIRQTCNSAFPLGGSRSTTL